MPARHRRGPVARSLVGVVLDAGALIEIERGTRWIVALLAEVAAAHGTVVVPAGVLAQVWRGPTGVRLARVLKARETEIVSFDAAMAYAAGELLARARTKDVVDASVVLAARAGGHPIVTSDPGDLRRLDPTAAIFRADTGAKC